MVPTSLFNNMRAQRDQARRAFAALEEAINHHMRDLQGDVEGCTDVDLRLWVARDKIVEKWHKGEI